MNQKKNWPFITTFVCTWCLFISTAFGADFNVSDITQFQSALTSAAVNGENDTIYVAAGTYNISSTLSYVSSENYSLLISGTDKGSTVLSGGGTVQILSASTTQPESAITIRDLTFQNGTTTANGGALNIISTDADITLDTCEVSDSTATGGDSVGGGASLSSDTGTMTVTSCQFLRNSSNGNVGGLYVATVTGALQMTKCTFSQNSVVNTGGAEYYGDGGGAMFYSDSTSQGTVRRNCFTGNRVSGGGNSDGGGLMTYQLGADSTLTVENNSFTNNNASLGGGGCILRFNASGNAIVRNNSFSGNQTTNGSGAGAMVYINAGSLTYSDNHHTSNTSGEDGAGAWINFSTGNATISSNVFSANQSTNNGGGLSVVTESATVSFSQNIIYNNQADGVGGGFSYATTSGVLNAFNNTFYGNTASSDGGGVYLYFDQNTAASTLKNNILWQDSPNELGYSFGSAGPEITMTYSNVHSGNDQSWFGMGCISKDPMFLSPAAGEFALKWESYPIIDTGRSPCIDTADPTSTNDNDGTRADMGAIAFLQAEPTVRITDLSLSYSSPLNLGDAVIVSVDAAADDASPLYYKFYYRGNYGTDTYDSSPWNVIQAYSTSSRASVTFNENGSYVIVVRVAANPANEPPDIPVLGGVVTVGGDSHSVACLGYASNLTGTLSAGSPVTFSASAETTDGETIYFQFYYRANYGTDDYDSSPWIVPQAYSTNEEATFSFPAAGSYIVVVRSVTDPSNEPAGVPIMGGIVVVE